MPCPDPDCRTDFVERAGLLGERDGFPRIAGRILGLLLVCSAPMALETIAERLGVSRASVSTGARLLEDKGLLERVGQPGDRRDFYRLAPQHHLRSLEHRLAALRDFVQLLDEAAALPLDDAVVHRRLADTSALYRDVLAATSSALERWRGGAARAETRTTAG